ncbi:MAG TPA: hypothetical protein VH134_00775 [Candidatus Dormibacteraeota bacterium]|nr:hypothetical protein [Candidatus Dormibacteraeota bacterium]
MALEPAGAVEAPAGPDGEALRASCLVPCMPLLLRERPADSRSLAEGLCAFGFRCDARAAGRRLRSLERGALVQRCAVPGRYRLTRRGRSRLDASARALAAISRRLEAFFGRCETRQASGSGSGAGAGAPWHSGQRPSTVRTLSPT